MQGSASHRTASAKIKRQGIEPCPGLVERQLFLHFVLLHFTLLHFTLLGGLLGGLLLLALLHFRLLVVLHRLSAGVGRGQSRAAGNGEHRGDQDGDELPHVFLFVKFKEQVATSPLLRNQSLPLTPCPSRG